MPPPEIPHDLPSIGSTSGYTAGEGLSIGREMSGGTLSHSFTVVPSDERMPAAMRDVISSTPSAEERLDAFTERSIEKREMEVGAAEDRKAEAEKRGGGPEDMINLAIPLVKKDLVDRVKKPKKKKAEKTEDKDDKKKKAEEKSAAQKNIDPRTRA